MKAEDVIRSNEDYVVTESRIPKDIDPADLFAFCREQRTSGTLVFEFFRGGIRQVFLNERTLIPEGQRLTVRKAIENQ
jgi:hypothetical protein